MAFFTDLTTSLKQKWLQYFQINRSWLARQMEAEYIETPDGGRRPSSYLILGAVSALEPQLAELIGPFTKLNPDINALIDVLELNFDPERVQSNSSNFTATPRSIEPDATMDALMGIMVEEEPDSTSSRSSRVEVVNRTAQGNLQQQPLEPSSTSRSDIGDVWLDELNQETKSQSEPVPDNSSDRQEKRSEDEEISRLFPEF